LRDVPALPRPHVSFDLKCTQFDSVADLYTLLDPELLMLVPVIIGDHAFYPPEEHQEATWVVQPSKAMHAKKPFRAEVRVQTKDGGEQVAALATVDNGAMMVVMDLVFFAGAEHAFRLAQDSNTMAQLADGTVKRLHGRITMDITLAGVRVRLLVEIINMRGAFQLLLSKPWKVATGSVYEYATDVIRILVGVQKWVWVNNAAVEWESDDSPDEEDVEPEMDERLLPEEHVEVTEKPDELLAGPQNLLEEDKEPHKLEQEEQSEVPLKRSARQGCGQNPHRMTHQEVQNSRRKVLLVEQGDNTSPGALPTPARRVDSHLSTEMRNADESSSSTLADLADEYAAWLASLENAHAQEHFEKGVCNLDKWIAREKPSQTEMKDWFSEERVTAIQSMVKIGEDLAPDKKQAVLDLVAWYANIFMLSLSKVQTVNVVEHSWKCQQAQNCQRS
jgi:hypothetical protein